MIDDAQGRFVVDFGASSMTALKAQNVDPASIDAVYLTHLHGDHFGGLPYLLSHRRFISNPETPLTIAGPPGFSERLRALSDCVFPDIWTDGWGLDLQLVEIPPGEECQIAGRTVRSEKVRHSAGPEPATALRISGGGIVIAYSGDTGWTDALIDISAGSDLFICDCNDRHDQSFDGHLSYDTLCRQLSRLDTKRLIVTHLGPDMISATDTPMVERAFEGMVIRF